MRSWGSTPLGGSPAPEGTSTPASFTPVVPVTAVNGNGNVNGGEKKKKGKKGDKGGTGSNAGKKAPHNQALANAETVIVAPGPPTTEEGATKKRKRDDSVIPTTTPTAASTAVNGVETSTPTPSEKTLKRLRKNVSKLESTEGGETISLSEYLGRVGKGKKDEVIDRDTLLAGLKVGWEGGKWVLSV
jgi:cell growth-regulating nucleolar protein